MAERDHLSGIRFKPVGYEQDYAAWVDQQVDLLRERRFDALDLANLLDEVKSLGRSDFRAFVSAIEVVLIHLLKWDHQRARRSRSWQTSILEHRIRITDELTDSPSYIARIDEAIDRAFRTARLRAANQTKLPIATFPPACPYDWATIIGREHPLAD